jgi:hypothetical protein
MAASRLIVWLAAMLLSIGCQRPTYRQGARATWVPSASYAAQRGLAAMELERLGAKVQGDTDGRIKKVKLGQESEINLCLEKLRDAGEVEEVEIRDCQVSPAGWALLGRLQGLVNLYIYSTPVNESALESLRPLTGLRRFCLDHTRAPAKALAPLAAWPDLQEIYLFEPDLTDDGLIPLRDLKHLNRLVLPRTRISDVGLDSLQGHRDLQDLMISETRLTDAGLKRLLPKLTHLRSLGLSGSQLTEANIRALRQVQSLQALALSGKNNTDRALARLKGLSNINSLLVLESDVTDAGLAHLKDLPHLRVFAIQSDGVTRTGLAHLQGLPSLRLLSLDLPQVAEETRKEIQDAFPGVTIVFGMANVRQALQSPGP